MKSSQIILIIAIFVIIGAAAFIINYNPSIQKEKSPGIEKSEPQLAKEGEIKKIKQEIKTEAVGEIIKYQEESFYSGDDFTVILENREKFKSQLIQEFKKKIIGVKAENCEVKFTPSKKSATLKCDIKGARYGTNSYSMHFLLGNWKFDLYQFKESEKKLVYDGKIQGIPTKIIFEFSYPIDHCHEHVWPR